MSELKRFLHIAIVLNAESDPELIIVANNDNNRLTNKEHFDHCAHLREMTEVTAIHSIETIDLQNLKIDGATHHEP